MIEVAGPTRGALMGFEVRIVPEDEIVDEWYLRTHALPPCLAAPAFEARAAPKSPI